MIYDLLRAISSWISVIFVIASAILLINELLKLDYSGFSLLVLVIGSLFFIFHVEQDAIEKAIKLTKKIDLRIEWRK